MELVEFEAACCGFNDKGLENTQAHSKDLLVALSSFLFLGKLHFNAFAVLRAHLTAGVFILSDIYSVSQELNDTISCIPV